MPGRFATYLRFVITQVDISEANPQVYSLLALVDAGEEVVIVRDGAQVAQLVPMPREIPLRSVGSHRGGGPVVSVFDDAECDLDDGWFPEELPPAM